MKGTPKKIKRDVDFTKAHLRKPYPSKYNFDDLKIGTSFVVPFAEKNACAIAASRYMARTGKVLSVKRIKLDDGTEELRCGRVS